MQDDLDDLVTHISMTSGIPLTQSRRLVGDVLAHFAESQQQYVLRRHGELAAQGLKNEAIFEYLQGELRGRRFTAPALTTRQIRRMIYG